MTRTSNTDKKGFIIMKKFLLTIGALTLCLTQVGCSEDNDAPAVSNIQVEQSMEEHGDNHAHDHDDTYMEETANLCTDFGPQTPRDISQVGGKNMADFTLAPAYSALNLCNIHTHTNAEHKGPGFSVFVNDSKNGGYACNETGSLTPEELTDPANGQGAYGDVKPGDTIEVHWVHTSCDIKPGEGLGPCLSEECVDPLLRVETQVFLVVNDENALDFNDFDYAGMVDGARHQAKSIPTGTGEPVVFRGSTTGPKYTQSTCSPMKVTWSVRPQCAKVDISSLNEWAAKKNVFNETGSHGVRQLVTAPELLSPIQ